MKQLSWFLINFQHLLSAQRNFAFSANLRQLDHAKRMFDTSYEKITFFHGYDISSMALSYHVVK